MQCSFSFRSIIPGDMSIDEWLHDFWNKGSIPWHHNTPNHNLLEHYDMLCNGRSEMRVFVPLCGKAEDMYWLYTRGHTVVGVDITGSVSIYISYSF